VPVNTAKCTEPVVGSPVGHRSQVRTGASWFYPLQGWCTTGDHFLQVVEELANIGISPNDVELQDQLGFVICNQQLSVIQGEVSRHISPGGNVIRKSLAVIQYVSTLPVCCQ
jgi:hypothetical protein